MAKNDQGLSCEIPLKAQRKSKNRSRYYPFQENFTWKGVKVQKYKSKGRDWSEIFRQVLIGACGEPTKFHLRYFEIKKGGYSSFETHKHEHVVIGIRGKGVARINRRSIYINFLDVLYINSNTPHRFYNPNREPFGFFCIVNANRDRPKPVKN